MKTRVATTYQVGQLIVQCLYKVDYITDRSKWISRTSLYPYNTNIFNDYEYADVTAQASSTSRDSFFACTQSYHPRSSSYNSRLHKLQIVLHRDVISYTSNWIATQKSLRKNRRLRK